MKVFRANPTEHLATYQNKRYVHIEGGISREFLKYAQEFAAQKKKAHQAMEEWEFTGKKQQYLFEFVDGSFCPEEVFQFVSDVTGFPLEDMTLCERHVKIYEDVADAMPPAHKDRVASQITVGIPLEVPRDSYLILYPDDHLTINPFNSTALWRSSLDEEQLPENVLKDIEPQRLTVVPGDVIFFEGHSIYHERVNPAHTTLLYLKFNAMRLDPIGEDGRTLEQNKNSKKILATHSDAELLECRVEVSPRLENLRRLYTRLHWKEVIQGNIVGEKEFTLSEQELQIFFKTSPNDKVKDIMLKLGVPFKERFEFIKHFRRLGNLQALDFKS